MSAWASSQTQSQVKLNMNDYDTDRPGKVKLKLGKPNHNHNEPGNDALNIHIDRMNIVDWDNEMIIIYHCHLFVIVNIN